jgi:hypothetical protein
MCLITVFVLVAGLALSPAAAHEDRCNEAEVLISDCAEVGGSLTDDSAVISGQVGLPGSGGGGTSGGGGSATEDDSLCVQRIGDRCLVRNDRLRPGDDVPPITLTDIASFRPHPGVQYMEPHGWAVVGLDTNFYAVVGTQVQAGTLLGHDAAVRFTPVAYRWDYGDGTVVTLPTRGGTWAALGLPEFARTPTSHVYRTAGHYVIRLTIEFRAEYRFAGGAYVPIAGRLALPANELRIRAGSATTVLVDRDCTRNPDGPGC